MPEFNTSGPEDNNFKAGEVQHGPLEKKLDLQTAVRVLELVDSVQPNLEEIASDTQTYIPENDGVYRLVGNGGIPEGYSDKAGRTIILKKGDVRILITDFEGGAKKILRSEGNSERYIWKRDDGTVYGESMYGPQPVVEDGIATTTDREIAEIEDEIKSFVPDLKSE